jgi:acetylornithine/N-succinyldiaminopimelate aminotransferase
LEALKDKYDCIVDHRGVGLIQGLEFKDNPSEIVKRALENGLVIIAAGNNTIRFVPPLVVSNADVDKMISILEKVIK